VRRAELVILGRIATLAGDRGFGWVEAIAVGDGRVLAAGRRADVLAYMGPGTRRLALEPDEVALPGLTDAHLHLASAAMAVTEVDLSTSPDLDDGLARIARVHAAHPDPDAWIRGAGWDLDRWGGWPTATALERVAPGRLVALWAHDHHSLWASRRALAVAGVDAGTRDPAGGRIRRGDDGEPDGCLQETAARLVAARIPAPDAESLAAGIAAFTPRLLELGITAVHDPGWLAPDPSYPPSLVAYATLADAARLGVRVHASVRQESLAAVAGRALHSGDLLGEDPMGRARLGWLKLFADGTLGSRTAALLAPMERNGENPAGPHTGETEQGIFLTTPGDLAALAARAATLGIATQIHAIGDHAARVALAALERSAPGGPLVPRVEHVQLLDPADLGRFAAGSIAASVQPGHLRSDAPAARRLWGERAEAHGYPLASLVESGALLAFGTDAPVESIDPWPGIEIAVTRSSGAWGPDRDAFGAQEALTLDRALRSACLDGALIAGEADRGRLIAGHRADLVVLPGATLAEPVEPDGLLGQARPRLVLVDGAPVLG
jgi:predicted amidohydrolase YtcJ